jgi:hypothetical protein
MGAKEIEENIAITEAYVGDWLKLRQELMKVRAEDALITEEDERQFMSLKSNIARQQQGLLSRLNDELLGREITALLRQIITLQHVMRIDENQRSKIFRDWHASYIKLNDHLGILTYKKDTEEGKVIIEQKTFADYLEAFTKNKLAMAGIVVVVIVLILVILQLTEVVDFLGMIG